MQNLKYILIILALAWAAYSNSFSTPMHYDDSVNIIRNKSVQIDELSWSDIKGSMFAGGMRGDIYHPVLYRPLVMVSFALNYYFHQLDVLGYHLVNFAIHCTAGIFLFLFIRLWLKDDSIALLAAVLWMVCPVNMSSVTYIVQRMTSMAGMFYIMAMYFYLKGRKTNYKYFILSGVCAICAVCSKENAIMVFPSILLFEMMFFKRKNKLRFAYISLLSVFTMILAVLAVSGPETFSSDTLMAGYAKRHFTLTERLLTEPRVILFYIMMLAVPSHNLISITHMVQISHGLFNPPEALLSIVVILVIIGIAIKIMRKHPVISYCIFFFFLNHLIEGTIFPLELMYEHRNYTPALFFYLPIAILTVHLFKTRSKAWASALVSLLVAFSVYNTYYQNEIWGSDLALWEDTVKKSPDPRSMFNLAGAYYTINDSENALKYWSISRNFNQIYGTTYEESENIIPYGRVMHMAHHNASMLRMVRDGKIRKAWTSKHDFSKFAVIKESNG